MVIKLYVIVTIRDILCDPKKAMFPLYLGTYLLRYTHIGRFLKSAQSVKFFTYRRSQLNMNSWEAAYDTNSKYSQGSYSLPPISYDAPTSNPLNAEQDLFKRDVKIARGLCLIT